MKHCLIAAALAGASLATLIPRAAHAQIAAAIGRPLPSPDLAPGTISVRVVAGTPAAPVIGTDVTMIVNGTPREARTDSAGRATFVGLPVGATVQAKIAGDNKEAMSEPFVVPDSSGARVMLSTKPWAGGAAAPFAGGAMPEPRQMSGEPRPDRDDPPGTFTVRVTYNDLALVDGKPKDPNPPVGTEVALIAYAADNTVTVFTQPVGKDGLAHFEGLDQSGGTSYFSTAVLPRNGATDRMASTPVELDAQGGVRVILSAEKRTATTPPVDDLGKLDSQAVATAAGKVRISVEGVPDASAIVRLVDAATHGVVGTARPAAAAPDPSRVVGGAKFDPKSDLPAGTLDVEIRGGPGQADEPIGDIEIHVFPAALPNPTPTDGLASKTAADGSVRMAVQATAPMKASFTVNGRTFLSEPFDLTRAGGKLSIGVHWELEGKLEATIDARAPEIVYAEVTSGTQTYRSEPFETLAEVGTHVTVYVYPRTLFHFKMGGLVEDQMLAVQGRFEVSNYSWAPYRAGPDGLVVPLPAGFKGGVVFDPDQAEVAVAPGEGLRILRPIPPGGRQFHGGFSLAVSDGNVNWAMDLPFGTYQSHLEIREVPGMHVQLPEKVSGQDVQTPEGASFVIDDFTIFPKHSMQLSISGLPTPPAWRLWVPRIVGIVVVSLMLGGLALALGSRRKQAAIVPNDNAVRRQKLLDELVELERAGTTPGSKGAKRRETLLADLERIWSD